MFAVGLSLTTGFVHAQFEEVSFESLDGLEITADLYFTGKESPTVVMFHQSVSSRGEFRNIAPQIQKEGFNCLAVDLRWGKKDFWEKVPNETAKQYGTYEIVENYDNSEAYQLNKVWPVIWKASEDMQATLEYLVAEEYSGPKLVMGSSFSAMLAFKLAAESKEVDGVLAFSPGEYHPTNDSLLADWSQQVSVPVYLSAGKDEMEMVKEVADYLAHTKVGMHQSTGRHGASVLISEGGDWLPLLAFLEQFKKAIGFKVISIGRSSETWDPRTNDIKPLTGYLWYPTSAVDARMNYQQYVYAISPEKDSLANTQTFSRIVASLVSEDTVESSEMASYLMQKSPAILEASKLENKTPLIVLSGAHPVYFMALAEQLASVGYVVLSVPKKGLVKGGRLPFDKAGVGEYKTDLNAFLDYLEGTGFTHLNNISFISWSFEGIPTLELAKEKGARVFISLDSSIGYDYGEKMVTLSARSYKDLLFPVLHFSGKQMDFGKSFDFIHRLQKKSDLVVIDHSFDLPHVAFTSLSSMTLPSIQGEETSVEYQTLLARIIEILNENE